VIRGFDLCVIDWLIDWLIDFSSSSPQKKRWGVFLHARLGWFLGLVVGWFLGLVGLGWVGWLVICSGAVYSFWSGSSTKRGCWLVIALGLFTVSGVDYRQKGGAGWWFALGLFTVSGVDDRQKGGAGWVLGVGWAGWWFALGLFTVSGVDYRQKGGAGWLWVGLVGFLGLVWLVGWVFGAGWLVGWLVGSIVCSGSCLKDSFWGGLLTKWVSKYMGGRHRLDFGWLEKKGERVELVIVGDGMELDEEKSESFNVPSRYGHTNLIIPLPVRSAKSSMFRLQRVLGWETARENGVLYLFAVVVVVVFFISWAFEDGAEAAIFDKKLKIRGLWEQKVGVWTSHFVLVKKKTAEAAFLPAQNGSDRTEKWMGNGKKQQQQQQPNGRDLHGQMLFCTAKWSFCTAKWSFCTAKWSKSALFARPNGRKALFCTAKWSKERSAQKGSSHCYFFINGRTSSHCYFFINGRTSSSSSSSHWYGWCHW
jgi:hypothetical protein